MTSSKIDNAELEGEPHLQLGFISAMPSDIVLEIFAYLDQQDCLTCMTVCRAWHNEVPEYTRDAWKELRLSMNILTNRRRVERCVGSHVKKLIIGPRQENCDTDLVEENELHSLLQNAVSWGCTEIESIELIRCVTTHLDAFLASLRKLTPRIVCLKMTKHVSSIEVLHVFYALPQLTHFACQYGDIVEDQRPFVIRELELPNDYSSNITHLWLDTKMIKEYKESILKRCPNLQCYMDTSGIVGLPFGTVDLDLLFSCCPKISVLESNYIAQLKDPDAYVNDQGRLRFVNVSSGHGIDKIARHLTNNQDTLEFLSIWKSIRDDDWSQVFQTLQMPNLRTLISASNRFNARALVAMLNHCPALETLDLYLSRRLPLDATTIMSIPKMHHLKYLNLGGIVLDDCLSILLLLEHFPMLEKLVLRRMPLSVKLPAYFESPGKLKYLELPDALWKDDGSDDTEKEVAIASFIKYLIGNSKIETIQLPHVPTIGRRPLLTLATISTLITLDVQVHHALHSDGLAEFIRMLHGTAITTLSLRYIGSLPFVVLNSLAKLPLLQAFYMKRIVSSKSLTRVSKSGLQQLLRRSPKLKTISFESYTVVEEGGKPFYFKELVPWIKIQVPESRSLTTRPGCWNVILDKPGMPETVFRGVTFSR